jgi:hypothetical protein
VDAVVMNVALGTLRRREREPLARSHKAEGRASRERTRNSRIALVCFIALSAAITFGVRTTWAPAPIKITSMKVPTDADSRKFAENHTGRLFFDSLDGAICREMRFNNDTGRISSDKSMRCDDVQIKQDDIADAPQTDARVRAFSIRGGLSSH